jgi:hypothetical protein
MDHSRLILVSSHDAQQHALGELLRSRVGGLLILVDGGRKAPSQPEADVVRVRPDRLDQLYCTVAAAQHACSVLVFAQAVPAVLDFLEQHAGTAGDFASIICSSTPDPASQQTVIDTLTRLSRMGADHEKLTVAFTQAPHAVPVQEAFAQLVAHTVSGEFRGVSLEAVLHQSQAFERARDLQLDIGGILRGELNFETALAQARQAGEREHVLHGIARKLLAQRALTCCRQEIDRTLDALRVPHTPGHVPLYSST